NRSSCQELIVDKFRQLSRTKQHIIAHKQGRRHLRVPMLCCMHVEHELRERALEPREAAHQYNKARARKLRSDFEIHLSEHLSEIEMLLRRESVVGLGTETMMLDVLCCIVAVGHVLKRQVGDLRERVIERVRELLFFRLERRNFGFEAR